LSKHRHNAHCERYRLWLLKNSVSAPNKQNLGDRKCLGDLRKSLVGLPDAISFLRISREGVFQQPRLVATVICDLERLPSPFAGEIRVQLLPFFEFKEEKLGYKMLQVCEKGS